jgi:phosphoribosyl-AMP cyclohydrolase
LPSVCGYRATSAARRPCCCHKSERIAPISASESHAAAREQGAAFLPKFDSAGLLTAIAQGAASGAILMVAFMDREALDATRETGFAHFHSRSRGRLWKKGESSGHVLAVEAILVDCDQDALVLKVRPAGPACHTGARTCFYRALEGESLSRIDG